MTPLRGKWRQRGVEREAGMLARPERPQRSVMVGAGRLFLSPLKFWRRMDAARGQKPEVAGELVLPSTVSGCLWDCRRM